MPIVALQVLHAGQLDKTALAVSDPPMKTIRSINSGGYGEVFEVEMPDGSRVALKKFRPQGALNSSEIAKARKRFVREVGMQQRLAKYGTLPILESGLTDDPPWFTMPLADRNYREQIALDRTAGTITPDPLADILNCLEEVHQRGFVHRDLKPENILRVDGRWYLSDFGLAIDIDHMATQKLTTTGSAYGTPMYMAPEQARDFSRVTPAADIFSFGCILHDLVDGGIRGFFHYRDNQGTMGLLDSPLHCHRSREEICINQSLTLCAASDGQKTF